MHSDREVGRTKLHEDLLEYQQAIISSPDCAESHHQLGLIWTNFNRLDIALPFHQAAFNLSPQSQLYSTTLAGVYKQCGMRPDAISMYQQSIELEPSVPDCHHQLGDLLLTENSFAEAEEAYQRAVDLNTQNPWTYHNQGRALVALSRRVDAIPKFRKAVDLSPNAGVFHFALGEALQALNKDEAEQPLSEAARLAPDKVEYQQAIGTFFNARQRWSDAIPWFVRALECNPGHLPCYRLLGDALWENGDISSQERAWCEGLTIPQHIVDRLFSGPIIEEVDLNSEEVSCLASKPASEVQLTPKSASAPESGSDEKYLQSARIPPAHVVEIKNGRAWGDGANSAVLTASGRLVKDVSTRNSKLVARASVQHPVTEINGVAAFMSHNHAHGNNFFHWLFNDLARLHLLELAGIELQSIDKFVFAHLRKGFYQEYLDVLGVPASKVIQSCVDPHIKADRLLVPSPTGTVGTSLWACEYLRKKFTDPVGAAAESVSGFEKIYISRNNAPYRKVANEEELLPVLEKEGFKSVKLESMSVGEKARVLSSVKVLVAPHGAALTNLFFCSPGAKVVEIFPKSVAEHENLIGPYPVIAQHCKLDHYYYYADDLSDQESRPQLMKDIRIDKIKFEKMLRRMR